MEYTNRMALSGKIAAQNLSEKAFSFYSRLSPFSLYEYDTADGKRYAYSGVIGEQNNLTFSELQGVFEELHRLLIV